MNYRLFYIFLFLTCVVFAERVPIQLRAEYALKMHQGFCLQSCGQSGSAFMQFNDGYQKALRAGISPRKLHAIWNFFVWYRKFGRFLELFETTGDNWISDEYREDNRSQRVLRFRSEADKKRDKYEIAEISRQLVANTGEMIGGLLGAAFLPSGAWRVSSLLVAVDALKNIWNGCNRLKTFNEIAKAELKQRIKELENAAANKNDEEWWLY